MSTDVQAGSAAYDARRRRREDSDVGDIWRIIDSVTDPEIPVVSIWDLGILTDVERRDGTVRVSITPTYCGCPAVDCIRSDIASALRAAGITSFEIRTTLAPAWTTDWISPEGRAKMLAFGIAVPQPGGCALDGRHSRSTPARRLRRGRPAARLSCCSCHLPIWQVMAFHSPATVARAHVPGQGRLWRAAAGAC